MGKRIKWQHYHTRLIIHQLFAEHEWRKSNRKSFKKYNSTQPKSMGESSCARKESWWKHQVLCRPSQIEWGDSCRLLSYPQNWRQLATSTWSKIFYNLRFHETLLASSGKRIRPRENSRQLSQGPLRI
jgi:hypothetical protein